MLRFLFHFNFKRALPVCFLALAFCQSPCLAQNNSKSAGQPVGAADVQAAPDAIHNFVETSSSEAEPFASSDYSWLNGIFFTEEPPTDSTSFQLDGPAAGAPSSGLGGTNPQNTAQSANGQTSGINKNYQLKGNFFQRLVQFYQQDWAGTNPAGPSITKRGLPAPLDSPPFPSSDWIYGGAPDIGAPDGNTYPLMSALNLDEQPHESLRMGCRQLQFQHLSHTTTFRSHMTFSRTRSNSIRRSYTSNACLTPCKTTISTGDTMSLDSTVSTIASRPRRATSASNSWQSNKQYGFDPVLEYFDLYFPVKDGLNIRIGRFLSVPGIEAQLAPNNYNMTHSLLYTIDPFTDTGIYATLKLNKQWMVQFGVSCSHDVACWTDDAQPSGIFCLNYSTSSNNDNFYGCGPALSSRLNGWSFARGGRWPGNRLLICFRC